MFGTSLVAFGPEMGLGLVSLTAPFEWVFSLHRSLYRVVLELKFKEFIKNEYLWSRYFSINAEILLHCIEVFILLEYLLALLFATTT